MKVILDTNFFMVPEKFKIDVFGELDRIIDEKYELITIDSVINELEGLSRGNEKMPGQQGLG